MWALAPKLEIEQAAVESQSLFNIANFKSDMVETDGARFLCLRHATLSQISANDHCRDMSRDKVSEVSSSV